MGLDPDSAGDGFSFSAGTDERRRSLDAYRALYGAGAGTIDLIAADFSAEIRARRMDRLILFDRRLRGLVHVRGPEHVATNGFDHFTLQLNVRGLVEVDAGDGYEPLAEGEAVLLSTRAPMALRLIDVHLVTASIAREMVVSAVGDVPHGRRIGPDRTAALRRRLAEEDAGGPPLDEPRLLVEILESLAPEDGGHAGGARMRRKLIQRALVRDFVELNLASRDLTPAAIASACAVSRAALYRLTEPDGGVASFVRKVRLARLERLLAAGDGDPLAQLADRLGFADQSHMSRQFRAVTGVSPGRYRSASLDDGAAGAARRRWAAWMADFR